MNYEEVINDPCGSIDEWLLFLLLLRNAYGGDAELRTWAGYNNVSLFVESPTTVEETRITVSGSKVRHFKRTYRA